MVCVPLSVAFGTNFRAEAEGWAFNDLASTYTFYHKHVAKEVEWAAGPDRLNTDWIGMHDGCTRPDIKAVDVIN
jgi:hypothetical protein